MKKIAVLLVLLSVFMLASCKKDEAEEKGNEIDTQLTQEVQYEDVEGVVSCYFSRLTEGFANYLLAFPETFVDGYQASIGYANDDEKFATALENATHSLFANRDVLYEGCEYKIEYTIDSEIEMTDDEKADLLEELSLYCYINAAAVEDIILYKYNVREYGIDLEGGFVNEQIYTNEINFIKIKGEGWKVAPNEFELA